MEAVTVPMGVGDGCDRADGADGGPASQPLRQSPTTATLRVAALTALEPVTEATERPTGLQWGIIYLFIQPCGPYRICSWVIFRKSAVSYVNDGTNGDLESRKSPKS